MAALGRLEPQGGVITVSAPATPLSLAGTTILRLEVKEGDRVTQGQLLAVTDAEPALAASSQLAEAELEKTRKAAVAAEQSAEEACVIARVLAREAQRRADLLQRKLAAEEETEQARGDAEAQAASCAAAKATAEVAVADIGVAQARLTLRQAEYERAFVRSPFQGIVLRVIAEPGEYVGLDGILELGRSQSMFAIAEVFETDIHQVRIEQPATVTSDGLPQALSGTVAFIRPKVQKQDTIGTDPAARKNARVIEVGIRLDNSELVANLTNLQVEVVIGK